MTEADYGTSGVTATEMAAEEGTDPTGRYHRRNQELALDTLRSTLAYAARRDYSGYDYSDGMSSTLRTVMPGDNRWVNLGIQEIAKRAPVNIRPLLLIPKRRSFKGSALFATATLGAYELTDHDGYLEQSKNLVDWLAQTRRSDPYGWGHNHDIQFPGRQIPRNTPNIVSTTYAARAIMELAEHVETEEYHQLADGIAELIREELLIETRQGHRIRYDPTADTHSFVLNANALAGALLVELANEFDRPTLQDLGESLLDYVASRQHPLGGWTYMDPPGASHLSMDNHHNGFVVESFLRYRNVTGSDRYADTLSNGLEFYRDVLFEPTGAPNWDENKKYPRDIHAAAQGLITFTMAEDLSFAGRIFGWTREHMYDGTGSFYYRRGRVFTRKFTLMRWCQAWMAYALAAYSRRLAGHR